MRKRIQQLPLAIANQIAAGEVIERPASVVKELLENAIDAHANKITIEIGYGGLNQIKLSDNGDGILAEDLPLAIAAHATSKISQLHDLWAITSLGFRGEALASIASISHLSISSCPAEQAHAMMLDNRTNPCTLKACARNQGTTIDVCDLFYNTPVRKKFLKSERLEYLAIENTVKRIALSHPEIAFQLIHNGKPQLQLAPAHTDQARLERVGRILGKAFIDHAYTLQTEHAGIQLNGFVSNEAHQRSQNDRVWIYLNGRMVKDKLLQHAVKQAYEDKLHPGRYPVCLLYITLDPAVVDVNVHPTKHEVRFREPRLVHDFICTQIRSVLAMEKIEPLIEPKKINNRQADYDSCMIAEKIQPIFSSKREDFLALALQDPYFLISSAARKGYIVQMNALLEKRCLHELKKNEQPLQSRPLLVPIYTTQSIDEEGVARLEMLGILIAFQGERRCIRSLPVSVPHLNVSLFLEALSGQAYESFEADLTLMAKCQTASWQLLTTEEREDVFQFIETHLNELTDVCCELTPTICRDLIHANQGALSNGADCVG